MGTVPYYYRTEKRREGGRGTAASKITYRTFFPAPNTFRIRMQSHIFRALSRFPALAPSPPPENRKKYSNEAKRSVCGKWRQFSYFPLSHHCQRRRRRNTTQTDGGGGGRKRVIMLPAERGKIVSGSLEGGEEEGGRGHFEGGRFLPRHSSFH